jgi:hypothetical protein
MMKPFGGRYVGIAVELLDNGALPTQEKCFL